MFFTIRVDTNLNNYPPPVEKTEIIGFNTKQLIHITKSPDNSSNLNSIRFILSNKSYNKSFNNKDDMDAYFDYLISELDALDLSSINNKLQNQDSQFIRLKWNDRNKKIREEIINKDNIAEIEKDYSKKQAEEYVVFFKWTAGAGESASSNQCDVNFTTKEDADRYFDYVMEKLCCVKFKEQL